MKFTKEQAEKYYEEFKSLEPKRNGRFGVSISQWEFIFKNLIFFNSLSWELDNDDTYAVWEDDSEFDDETIIFQIYDYLGSSDGVRALFEAVGLEI